MLGADYAVHNILHSGIGIEKAVEILKDFHDVTEGLDPTGNNKGFTLKFGFEKQTRKTATVLISKILVNVTFIVIYEYYPSVGKLLKWLWPTSNYLVPHGKVT